MLNLVKSRLSDDKAGTAGKKYITPIVISILLLFLFSCITFQTINQPNVSLPNSIITVAISAETEGGDEEPYFGVCLPIGWTVPSNSIQCSGVYSEAIYFDSLISAMQENVSPAPPGYYWWAGKGVAVATDSGEVFGELQIQTDSQLGLFSIDYMLGNGYNGVNSHRSNGHIIEIPDEYTPSGLQAAVVGNSISLIWHKPFNTGGLLGYYIYRDEQKLSPLLVTDTTFIDENPLEGIHYYSVSSYYSNGIEYLRPYEEQVMYGNSLYVSPNGSNNNSGVSFGEALLTIDFALSAIIPDSSNHKTIYLSEGIFSPSTNGEVYPLAWKNHVSLKGISEDQTILNADSMSRVISFESITTASIKDLTIRDGFSYRTGGAGIYCSNSSPELVSVNIVENYSDQGGGGIDMRSSNPKLMNVKIENNYAHNQGGGITCQSSSPQLFNVTISNNVAGDGGGIFCGESSPQLFNVTISNNIAAAFGGGIECLVSSDAELTNVNIFNNSAILGGGGINLWESDLKLTNVIISDNSSTYESGGILADVSNLELVNVSVVNNTGPDFGGLIIWGASTISLKNCIFWSNSPQEIAFVGSSPSSLHVSFSDIQGGETGIFNGNGSNVYWLEGNIDEDPLFTDGYLPFTLLSGSPCIDVGNPYLIYNDPEDPNNLGYALWPAMGTVRNDMGAYGGPNTIYWIVTGVEDDKNEDFQQPTEFSLSQNYPNPFNPSTTIQYSIKERSSVELILYDILGREVEVLVNEDQDAGQYKINLNAGGLASGIYFYRIQAGSYDETKKMILLK